MTPRLRVAAWVLLPLLGALLCYVLIPTDPIVYTEVIVPARAIEVREPPAHPPTIIERIRFVQVPPRQVATAPGGGRADVVRFCAPSVAAATGEPDPELEPTLLVRSGSHRPGWWWGRDELLVTGVTSHGALRAFDFNVRPGFDFRASGDSIIVRYPRPALLRESAEVGVPLILGYLLGRVW